ncbi:uncharacterized protein UMAG_04033 [Mycosarcoma maydis]|uniref:Uncharacterized protein n=1 Tax=Mycosarcoma maydis TaxID=5270 RepID=A0A0D1DUP3_MYCMD|nr:uncharacterized protein UMAG_04033 [Ustilago maydis 521]KIS67989.1 hypothetical protein UMAG_04033 [Ustilago maydis 521]|eukprot:XP_011390478.1 hypothetical protein UMAG_04033 [Ustilago maydis 521]
MKVKAIPLLYSLVVHLPVVCWAAPTLSSPSPARLLVHSSSSDTLTDVPESSADARPLADAAATRPPRLNMATDSARARIVIPQALATTTSTSHPSLPYGPSTAVSRPTKKLKTLASGFQAGTSQSIGGGGIPQTPSRQSMGSVRQAVRSRQTGQWHRPWWNWYWTNYHGPWPKVFRSLNDFPNDYTSTQYFKYTARIQALDTIRR